jgi:magnesium-protoporphyrin O-methyltransferase
VTCAHCCDAEKLFNDRRAKRELRKYRRKGPDKSTRLLIEGLLGSQTAGSSLLDIGGGVGAIQHASAEAGAAAITAADASQAYVTVCRSEAERRGYVDRADYHVGDFIELAESLPDADVVTLDRVVCCYPDMPRLIGASAGKAGRFYGLVFPRRRWPVRAVIAVMNVLEILKRNAFRVFVHDPSEIEMAVRAAGFERTHEAKTFVWHVEVYSRA